LNQKPDDRTESHRRFDVATGRGASLRRKLGLAGMRGVTRNDARLPPMLYANINILAFAAHVLVDRQQLVTLIRDATIASGPATTCHRGL
jgi:hypothetical protein